MSLPAEYEPDHAERSAWLGEHAHAAGALVHRVGRLVLRRELDLRELAVRGEQPCAHLVDEVLDRAAVELMERALELIADGARAKDAKPFGDAVAKIAVPPPGVEVDRERPVDE